MKENLTRRTFFKFAFGALAVVPVALGVAQNAMAAACPAKAPAGKKIGIPTEGMGKSLEYVEVAETSKNAKHQKGQDCGNCKFYNKAKEEGGYAPCTMMGMRYVTTCGWCKSYAKK